MTVAELIIELRKLEDQSVEVWVDTYEGLMPIDGLYFDSETAVITFDDPTIKRIYN
jgi:hypothetical protein